MIEQQKSLDQQITKNQFIDPFRSVVKKLYSYVDFNNTVYITSDMAVSVQSYLGQSDANGDTARFSGTDSEAEGTAEGIILRRGGDNVPNNILEHGTGQHFLILRGSATRIAFPVDLPYVSSVGVVSSGTKKTTKDRASEDSSVSYPVLFRDRIVPNQIDGYTADGKPIYSAAWERVYVLPSLGNRTIKIDNIDIRFMTNQKDYSELNIKDAKSTSQIIPT